MKSTKFVYSLLLSGALLLTPLAASAQRWQDGDHDRDDRVHDRDRDRDRDGDRDRGDRDDRVAFRQGVERGRTDARNGRPFNIRDRRWRERDDRRAYEEGYERGYAQSRHRGDGDDDADDRGNGRWGHGGWRHQNGQYGNGQYGVYNGNGQYGSMNQAGNIGYQDGLNDGANDRHTGHSYRPTSDDNYKNADRGYSSSLGSKSQYKQFYRQGYEQGYQQGYNGGFRR